MNTTGPLPEYYDDLDLSFDKAWDLIASGAKKRTSAAHTPSVATIGSDGSPQLRILVLRDADRSVRRLRFHTDRRSVKVGEVGHNIVASVLIYDPQEKIQIRLSGVASIATDGETVENAWRQSTTFARRCYMTESSPGEFSETPTSGLPDWIEGKQPCEEDLTDARANFALLWFEAHSLEWLYLANNGHRRAKWGWNDATALWTGNWLVP